MTGTLRLMVRHSLEGAVDVATQDGGAHEVLRPGSVAMVGARLSLVVEIVSDIGSEAMPLAVVTSE